MTDEQLDARVRSYLTYRADLVAARAVSAQKMTDAVARQVGVSRGRTANARLARLAFAVLLLLLALLAAAYAGGLFRERYAPNRPLLEIPLDGQPWGVTGAYGSMWVAAHDQPVMYRLDPADGSILNEVPLPAQACGNIEPGYGALWITSCQGPTIQWLSRVNPQTLDISRLVEFGAERVAIGANSVWATHGDAIARLNPATLETEAEIPMGAFALPAFGEGSAWAMVPDANVVRRIDAQTNSVDAEISWTDESGQSWSPVQGIVGGGALWVVDEGGQHVVRVDPDTDTAEALDIPIDFYPGTVIGDWYITYGRGLVWVRTSEREIVGIDPVTLGVVERQETPAGKGGGFFVADDSLWVGNNQAGTVSGMQLP